MNRLSEKKSTIYLTSNAILTNLWAYVLSTFLFFFRLSFFHSHTSANLRTYSDIVPAYIGLQ